MSANANCFALMTRAVDILLLANVVLSHHSSTLGYCKSPGQHLVCIFSHYDLKKRKERKAEIEATLLTLCISSCFLPLPFFTRFSFSFSLTLQKLHTRCKSLEIVQPMCSSAHSADGDTEAPGGSVKISQTFLLTC